MRSESLLPLYSRNSSVQVGGEGFRQKPLLICPPLTEDLSARMDALNDYVNTKLLAFWRYAKENEATPGIP
jgi:hypothetical protein